MRDPTGTDQIAFVSGADPAGTPLWTTATGDGPLTLLLSNGGPGCGDYLAPLADVLAGPGRRVVRWEMRGTGRSGGDPAGPFTLAQTLADLEAIRTQLSVDRWVIGGHSFGADLAVLYALTHPDHCAGILAVSGGRVNNDREWHAAYERGKATERPLPPDVPVNLAVNRQLMAGWKEAIQSPTLFRDLARLPVPAAFIYGADDIRPAWPVAQVAALLPAATLTLIPGADHYPYFSHPAAVRAAADAFLDRLTPGYSTVQQS